MGVSQTYTMMCRSHLWTDAVDIGTTVLIAYRELDEEQSWGERLTDVGVGVFKTSLS
jgi:hypothetical protein